MKTNMAGSFWKSMDAAAALKICAFKPSADPTQGSLATVRAASISGNFTVLAIFTATILLSQQSCERKAAESRCL